MPIGREAERAGPGRLLDAARAGTSGALVLRGEAGIGKTALLEHAAAAASNFRCCGRRDVARARPGRGRWPRGPGTR